MMSWDSGGSPVSLNVVWINWGVTEPEIFVTNDVVFGFYVIGWTRRGSQYV